MSKEEPVVRLEIVQCDHIDFEHSGAEWAFALGEHKILYLCKKCAAIMRDMFMQDSVERAVRQVFRGNLYSNLLQAIKQNDKPTRKGEDGK